MRAKMIVFLSFLIPFISVFIYVWATATNYVHSDEICLISEGLVKRYFNGTFAFSDLWRPFYSIRSLGPQILLLTDIELFSMNSRIFVLMIPFFLLSSALLIYHDYKKSLTPMHSQEFIAATFFILSFIIFNVIQWQALTCRAAFLFQIPMPLIIASYISLELYLTKDPKYWPMTFFIITFTVLVFGGTPIFSFLPALGITFSCYVLTHRASLKKDFYFRALITGIFLFVIMFIYMFRINDNDYMSISPLYLATHIFYQPLEALQFFLSAFGASIVGFDTFFIHDYFSFRSIVIIGLVLVLFYVYSLMLFFKSRMYNKTYLPFFLIMQTFFYLSFMTIARFGLGDIAFGMSSRYTCVSLLGLVGIVWIFIFVLTQSAKINLLLKIIIYAGFAIIFSGLLLTSIDTWRMQPQLKAKYEQLYDIAMRVDTASDDELWKFGADPKHVRNALLLLRQHKLNIYNTAPAYKKYFQNCFPDK